jgi:hypothetical protein
MLSADGVFVLMERAPPDARRVGDFFRWDHFVSVLHRLDPLMQDYDARGRTTTTSPTCSFNVGLHAHRPLRLSSVPVTVKSLRWIT